MLRKSARQQFGVLSRRSARFQNHAKKNIFSLFFFRGKFFDEDFSLKLQFSFSFTFFWPMNNFLEKIRKYFCEFFACVFGMCVVVIVAAAAFLCRLCSNSLHLNCVYREATRSPFAFAGYFSHIYSQLCGQRKKSSYKTHSQSYVLKDHMHKANGIAYRISRKMPSAKIHKNEKHNEAKFQHVKK